MKRRREEGTKIQRMQGTFSEESKEVFSYTCAQSGVSRSAFSFLYICFVLPVLNVMVPIEMRFAQTVNINT